MGKVSLKTFMFAFDFSFRAVQVSLSWHPTWETSLSLSLKLCPCCRVHVGRPGIRMELVLFTNGIFPFLDLKYFVNVDKYQFAFLPGMALMEKSHHISNKKQMYVPQLADD